MIATELVSNVVRNHNHAVLLHTFSETLTVGMVAMETFTGAWRCRVNQYQSSHSIKVIQATCTVFRSMDKAPLVQTMTRVALSTRLYTSLPTFQ